MGYKGKVWSLRYRGDETPLMREDGDGPRSSIEVVILKASKTVSKVWYEQGYVEGSTAAPDCFSNNGVTPEPTSLKKQCDTCALCPHNQWGSRITPAGKQGKACSDSKRIAITPVNDIDNEMFGGPMLLRVPAASLQDLAMYGQKMQQMGYPYYSIATRIQFDPAESYPKFKINAIRPLDDEEAEKVIALRDGHTVERILSENEFVQAPAAEQPASTESVFEQPPADEAKPQADAAQEANKAAMAKKVADAAAQAKAKAAADKKAALEAKAAELAAMEAELAAANEAPADEEDEESEEDRQLREMEERLAAMKAAKTAKEAPAAASKPTKATKATPAKKAAEAAPEPVQEASAVSDDDGNMASDFEANLDSMLSDLLPG